jgi:hypothetical protein
VPKPTPEKRTVNALNTITTEKALEVFTGISTIIRGYEKIVVGEGGKERAVPQSYRTDAQIAMRLKMNFKALKPIMETYQETRNEVIARLSNGGKELTAEASPAAFAEYLAENAKLLAEQHAIDLYKIDEDKLLAGDPSIPIVALLQLEPILNAAAAPKD